MKFHISETCLIKDLQEEFNGAYPFLRIEFYRAPSIFGQLSLEQRRLLPKMKWNEASKNQGEKVLEVNDSMTVTELEKMFTDAYGMSAQVFRKSGNIWLETTMTNGWTLKQQNEHGREISTIRKDYLRLDDREQVTE